MKTFKQEFVRFLKEHKLFEKYIGSIHTNSFIKDHVFSNSILYEPIRFITGNINIWEITDKRWAYYNNKWVSLCNKKYKNMFLYFLKENNIYNKYKYELRLRGKTIDGFLDKCDEPMSFLSESFNWVNTPQGYDFWREINRKWGLIYYGTV